MNFGSHLNVTFQGWDDLTEDQIKPRLDEVSSGLIQFQLLANQIDLGDDYYQEAISVKPFTQIKEGNQPMRVFEYLSQQKLAFDMGEQS